MLMPNQKYFNLFLKSLLIQQSHYKHHYCYQLVLIVPKISYISVGTHFQLLAIPVVEIKPCKWVQQLEMMHV